MSREPAEPDGDECLAFIAWLEDRMLRSLLWAPLAHDLGGRPEAW